MPGGHGTGEKPFHLQSKTELWGGVLAPLVFMCGLLAVSFLGTPRDPTWGVWLGRAIVVGFIAWYVRLGSLPRLHELRRRGRDRVPKVEPPAAADPARDGGPGSS